MEEIQEGIKSIQIEEEEKVKEIDINLTLDEKGFQKYTTEKINGIFKTIIIEKDITPVRIIIKLATHDIILFDKNIEKTTEWYNLKVQPQDSNGVNWQFDVTEIALNDQLYMELVGKAGQNVKVAIRYA